MSDENDTVSNDPDLREQALFEVLKSGAVQGVKEVSFDDLSNLSNALVCYEVPRHIVKYGFRAGNRAFEELSSSVPESSYGSIIFTFSGFMGTDNPLFMEKQVVRFIRGFLFGSRESPDPERASKAINLLFDERTFAFASPLEIDPEAFDIAGALWAIAHAFPGKLFLNDPTSPSGWSRKMQTNFTISDCISQKIYLEDDIKILLNEQDPFA